MEPAPTFVTADWSDDPQWRAEHAAQAMSAGERFVYYCPDCAPTDAVAIDEDGTFGVRECEVCGREVKAR